MHVTGVVYIVDVDPHFREEVRLQSVQMGYQACTFEHALQFFDALDPQRPGCVITELFLPEMNGLQVQKRLADDHTNLPVIMVTRQIDASMAIRVMKQGAVDFLQKPITQLQLCEGLQTAFEIERQTWEHREFQREMRLRLDRLTDDEWIVMEMLMDDQPKKNIAHELSVSVRTVDFRRKSLLSKLGAKSVHELIRMLTVIKYHGQPATNGDRPAHDEAHVLRVS